MAGCTSSKWICVVLYIGLAALPLAATPIATGPDGLDIFSPGSGSLTYQVVINNGGAGVQFEGFVPGGNPASFTSLVAGSMTLNNILSAGSTVSAAVLDLAVLNSLTPGAISDYYLCSGAECGSYVHDHPTITVAAYPATHTTITVISAGGVTYTWNYQVTSSSPFQLDLGTADPDFLTALSNGEDLTINWTQSIQLSGTYPQPTGSNKCRNCTLTFHYDGLSRSTLVQAGVNGTVSEPPPPPNGVPEPSSGLLLGLGLIVTGAVVRRKILPR
jgi:hypothetical protein